jgi:hypothetical protein
MVVTSCTTWFCSSGTNTEGMYVRPTSPSRSNRAIDWMTTIIIIIIIINRLIIMTPPVVVPIFAWVQPGRIGSRPRYSAAKTAGLRRPPDRRIGGSVRIGSQERRTRGNYFDYVACMQKDDAISLERVYAHTLCINVDAAVCR